MKLLISILAITLLAFAAGLYLPWWSVAIAGFIVAVLIYQPPARSFLSGFIGIFLLWSILAACTNAANNSILAHRVALVLPLGGSVFMLIFVTAFAGALAGGMGALSGSLLRKIGINGRVA